MRIAKGLIVFFSLAVVHQVHCQEGCSRKKFKPNTGCHIDIKGATFPKPAPLLLKPPGPDLTHDGYGFYLPNLFGVIPIAIGDVIRLACPGVKNYLKPLGRGVQEAYASCVGERNFNINGVTFDFRVLSCMQHPTHTARSYEASEPCYLNAISIEIGFIVGREFFRTIDICFNEATKSNIWSKFQMVPYNNGQKASDSDGEFVEDNFYKGMGMRNLYMKNTERKTVSTILGIPEHGQHYVEIDSKSSLFLAKGHMAANADFVYTSQQRSTFHYVNAAPQWQNFNNRNWGKMEGDVRKLAENKSTKLEVYTGTYGVMTLPNATGRMKEIWLSLDSNGNMAVPVPKLFWKVVYQPSTKNAIALLTLNNPHIDKPDVSYFICRNVCNQVTWLTWKPDDVKKGKSYCCSVPEFRAAVRTLPNLEVSGLLT